MSVLKDARDHITQRATKVHWWRLGITFAALVVVSFGLSWLIEKAIAGLKLEEYNLAYLAYFVVFFTTLISNMTIIAPVPVGLAVMIALAQNWNPVMIALAASIGGTIGELSGYYAGYLGKKIALPDDIIGYRMVERWVRRYGFLAIAILGFQPIIPFDIGGMVAGAARMPMHLFLPALWVGKFPKYLMITLFTTGVINSIPFLTHFT